jgi:cell division septation protein DedD
MVTWSKRSSPFICICFVLIALSTLVCGLIPANAGEPKRVALLPLRVNTDNELLYLRDGIYEMLSSRLFVPEGINPLSRQTVMRLIPAPPTQVTEASARDLARRLGADYVVFGSATLLGRGISLDLKTTDAAGSRPMKSFFDQAEETAGVIACIDRLAADIRNWMLERPPAVRAVAAETRAAPDRTPDSGDPQQHPEEMFRQDLARRSNGTAGMASETLGPEAALPTRELFVSSDRLQGVALGDVDGDGRVEVVAVTSSRVLVLGRRPDGLRQLYEFGEGGRRFNVGVDIADIDGNGLPEVFVTALAANGRSPQSFVLEFAKGMLRKKVETAPWYFRVGRMPGRGQVLLGQEPSQGSPPNASGGIFEMGWRKDRYEPEKRVLSSAGFNILGLACGWTAEDGRGVLTALDPENRIRVYDTDGKELWRSAYAYAGALPAAPGLPMRLVVEPASSSGPARLLVARNQEAAADAPESGGSRIIAFQRDGGGLSSAWIAGGIRGAIRDFAVEHAAGDAAQILAVVWRKEKGDAEEHRRSVILDLEVPRAGQAAGPVAADRAALPASGPGGEVEVDRGRSNLTDSRGEPERRKVLSAPLQAVAPPSSLPAPKATGAPAVGGGTKPWTIQIAALRSEPQALRVSETLRQKGYPVRIERAELPDTGLWFRVRTGEFSSPAEAQGTVDRLRKDGFAPMLFPTRTAP